jgi:polygalacturonase
MENSKGVLLENTFWLNSPYWTTFIEAVDGLEIRNCRIEATRVSNTTHTLIDLSAFNTDGFDFSGKNIYIHDCTVVRTSPSFCMRLCWCCPMSSRVVSLTHTHTHEPTNKQTNKQTNKIKQWNQDDSFCIKDNTENVLIENVEASGLGLTVGSIASHVRNVTFRNAHMTNTVKGIYLKFRGAGLIEDVLYENIVMEVRLFSAFMLLFCLHAAPPRFLASSAVVEAHAHFTNTHTHNHTHANTVATAVPDLDRARAAVRRQEESVRGASVLALLAAAARRRVQCARQCRVPQHCAAQRHHQQSRGEPRRDSRQQLVAHGWPRV